MSFFSGWAKRQAIPPQHYAKMAGLHMNTVYRRRRGEQGCDLPREVEILMRALEAVAGPSLVREEIERAAAELER